MSQADRSSDLLAGGRTVSEEKKKLEISESELIHMIKQNKKDGRKFVGVPTE